ncbi:MAG: hypothetical protein KGL41_03155 [Actinomycetales bacterium]|nr:hypothetical protein [Actinomycetales bacterium]
MFSPHVISRKIAKFGATLKLVLGVLVLAVSFVLPCNLAATPAWACSTAGQNSAGFNYSSQLTASTLVVCNSTGATASVPGSAVTSNQAPPKPVVVCSTKRQTIFTGPPTFATKQVSVTVCGTAVWVKNIVPPPPKSTTVTSPATQVSSVSNANASFSPDPIQLRADQTVLMPDEPAQFSAIAALHYRTGSLLGQGVTVRFTPTLISWDFGAGLSAPEPFGIRGTVSRSFGITGSQPVLAVVRFEAAYRFAGQTNWTTEAGYLAKDASVTVIVQRAVTPSAAAPKIVPQPAPKPPRVRLVAHNCMENPSARGCP